ncbi:MAG: RelA/SpoT family protein [Rikenellaceae bacterium]
MFTEKDDELIDVHFKELLKVCESTCKQEGDLERITKAFKFANKAHYGVRRKSGEPYIMHPISVAMIVVSEVGLGVKSVISALLHDVVEDTSYTVADIAKLFGEKISQMVDGLTKMKLRSNVETANSEQAENFKKMLLTLSDDVRVIIIKLADRLHNMRTLGSMPSHKQMKIVSETIYLFAPLAHRLGLYAIKSELEDLSLKYSFPEEYKLISNKISETENARNEYIDNFNAPIIEVLKQNNIEFEITGRVKSIYSIWRKMQKKSVTIDEIYDLFAIRIIFKSTKFVPEKSQCWHIYSLLTDMYKPKPDRIRDWVNIPKANGYEALHCTVMGQNGNWVEIQIRSTRMNDIAERGFAAHWKYKAEGKENGDNSNVLDKWIKDVRSALNSPTKDASEFLDDFKLNLYNTEVVVFTPSGETKTLPKGAIILDFAYELHSKLGNTAIGAKVNHKIVPLYTELKSGDQIEIITSQKGKPKLEWLAHVSTAKSKQAIKSFLKKDKESSIDMGIEIFDTKLRALHVDPKGDVFKKVLEHYKCATKDEFYSNLSLGLIEVDSLDEVIAQIKKSQKQNKLIQYWNLQLSNTLKFLGAKQKQEEKTKEIEVAKCCNPMPGDEVVGFKDESCITVHKKSCDVAIKRAARDGKSIVPVEWNSEKVMSRLMHLEIRGIDRMGILLELSQVLTSQYSVNIRGLSIDSHDGIFEGTLIIYISSKEHLDRIIERLKLVKGIDFVRCLEESKSSEVSKKVV